MASSPALSPKAHTSASFNEPKRSVIRRAFSAPRQLAPRKRPVSRPVAPLTSGAVVSRVSTPYPLAHGAIHSAILAVTMTTVSPASTCCRSLRTVSSFMRDSITLEKASPYRLKSAYGIPPNSFPKRRSFAFELLIHLNFQAIIHGEDMKTALKKAALPTAKRAKSPKESPRISVPSKSKKSIPLHNPFRNKEL